MYKKVWCLCRDVVCQSKAYSIGQFRVPPGLCIKTRLRAQPLIRKWFFILMQIKLFFTRNLAHLASFWKWGFLELGSGLLLFCRSRWCRRRRCLSSLLSGYRRLFVALLTCFSFIRFSFGLETTAMEQKRLDIRSLWPHCVTSVYY